VSRSSEIPPASFSTAHRRGAAWPFDSTKTSASCPDGSRGSYRISEKNSTDRRSAADMQLVGWPEPASAVDSSEWRRSFCAIWKRAASVGAMAALSFRLGRARGF